MNNMRYFHAIYENPDEDFDIKFELSDGRSEFDLPEEIALLHKDIEETVTIIKNLHYTPIHIKDKYFNKTLELARSAFITDHHFAIDLASEYVRLLRSEILQTEGPRIKNCYMKNLGIAVLIGLMIIWVLYLIMFMLPFMSTDAIQVYFIVCTGALVGMWLSFGARKFNITLQDLITLEEDKMNIVIRLHYIIVCAIVFLLLIKTGLVNLSIGSSNFKLWLEGSVEAQLLFGVFTGLLESKLGIQIFNKASNLLTVNKKN